MSILHFIIALCAVGIVMYCIDHFVPMDRRIKIILNVIVLLIMVVWVLDQLGLIDTLNSVRVPRAHGH